MYIQKISPKTTPLCYLPCNKLICYKDGSLLEMIDSIVVKRHSIFHSMKERIAASSHLLYRGLRLGIHTAVTISAESIVFSIGNILYEYNLKEEKLSDGFCLVDRIRPLVFTKVKGVEGFEDMLIFGGYLGNPNKNPVHIYKRVKPDRWEIVYTFLQGAINHVHNIVADPYRKCLWAFTGDFDEAAAIWKITDNFQKVERVCSNDQKYRACVVYALPEGLLYATDAPFADNYIYLMQEDLSVTPLYPIGGSCIYGCQWKDKYVFSSTVEADGRNQTKMQFLFSRKRGAGINDDYIHLYCGNLEAGFEEIYKEKKDMWQFLFQFGVFKFPTGKNNSDMLYFQPVATNNNDLKLLALKETNTK